MSALRQRLATQGTEAGVPGVVQRAVGARLVRVGHSRGPADELGERGGVPGVEATATRLPRREHGSADRIDCAGL